MAKKIEMFPSKGKQKKEEELSIPNHEEFIGGFIGLLRAVVDGNKEAIEDLRSMLDEWDKMGPAIPDFMLDEDEDGNEDYDKDPSYLHGPITLPRKGVKELHLRIKLNDIDMKIWRELKVPSNITLEALAKVLLDVMGWEHEHLYQFVIGNDYYELESEDDFFSPFSRVKSHDIAKYTISDVLKEKGKRIKFEYDFGDDWKHDLWIKGEREYDKGEKHVISCVKGQGACPPEDCGGTWGYEELLEARNKKKRTPEVRDRLEWYHMLSGFDPDAFDKEFVDELMDDWTNKLSESPTLCD